MLKHCTKLGRQNMNKFTHGELQSAFANWRLWTGQPFTKHYSDDFCTFIGMKSGEQYLPLENEKAQNYNERWFYMVPDGAAKRIKMLLSRHGEVLLKAAKIIDAD